MVIFYNPTEARSTLSFNNTNSADLFEFTEVAYAPWRPRKRPSPDLPLYGEEKEHSIAKVCRSIERACSVPSSGAHATSRVLWIYQRDNVKEKEWEKKNNLYGFSFAQRCILELSEALSLTKGK